MILIILSLSLSLTHTHTQKICPSVLELPPLHSREQVIQRGKNAHQKSSWEQVNTKPTIKNISSMRTMLAFVR